MPFIVFFELTLIVGSAGLLDPLFHRLKAIEWGPASERYSLCFLEHIHEIGTFLEIDNFFWSKWVPESSFEGFFLKNCCRFQLVTSCKGAPVQRLLCVKAFVCKSKILCVKTSLCESFFVWKPVCVKISLCVKASVCKHSLCKGFSV